jgi:hypothetical protein
VDYIKTDALSELSWASRLGASSPRAISLPGITLPTAVSGTAANGTGPCAAAHAVPRVKAGVSFFALPKQPDGVASLLAKTNIHNSMTRAYANGGGASGPPPREEPV